MKKLLFLVFILATLNSCGIKTRMVQENNLEFIDAAVVYPTVVINKTIGLSRSFSFDERLNKMARNKERIVLKKGDLIGKFNDYSIIDRESKISFLETEIEGTINYSTKAIGVINSAKKEYQREHSSINFDSIETDSVLKKVKADLDKLSTFFDYELKDLKLSEEISTSQKGREILDKQKKVIEEEKSNLNLYSPCDCVVYKMNNSSDILDIILLPIKEKPFIMARVPNQYIDDLYKNKEFVIINYDEKEGGTKYKGNYKGYLPNNFSQIGFPGDIDIKKSPYMIKIELSGLTLDSVGLPVVIETDLTDVMGNKTSLPDTLEIAWKGVSSTVLGVAVATIMIGLF